MDNVDRLAFDNWAEHQALYPEGRQINEMPYPRAKASARYRKRSGRCSQNGRSVLAGPNSANSLRGLGARISRLRS